MRRAGQVVMALLIGCAATGDLFGQVGLNNLGQSTMNFLVVSTSPVASGMGDAFNAVGVGSESMFYNPAGLVETKSEFDVFVNMTQWIADIRYLSSGIAWNLEKYGSVGVSVLTVDYGTIQGTSLLSSGEQALYPAGYKDNGPISNLSAYALGVSYAQAITPLFSIGGSVRLAAQHLGENLVAGGVIRKNNAQKLVFDAGVKYHTGFRSFRFGMSMRNFSSDLKREEIDETLPLTFSLGLAIDLFEAITNEPSTVNSLLVGVDFLHQNNYSERANLGVVYTFHEMISLRCGYQTNRDLASWSLGVGVSPTIVGQRIRVDYSYSRFDLFGGVNRFGIGVAF